jgi:hypothetical protein
MMPAQATEARQITGSWWVEGKGKFDGDKLVTD